MMGVDEGNLQVVINVDMVLENCQVSIILILNLLVYGTIIVQCHEEVLYLQPLIPPNKRFDIFSPLTEGCSEGLGAF